MSQKGIASRQSRLKRPLIQAFFLRPSPACPIVPALQLIACLDLVALMPAETVQNWVVRVGVDLALGGLGLDRASGSVFCGTLCALQPALGGHALELRFYLLDVLLESTQLAVALRRIGFCHC